MNTKILFSTLLCTTLLVACSLTPGVESATQMASPGEEWETLMPSATRPTQTAILQGDASLSEPLKIKVRPPNVPIGPEQGTSAPPAAGWRAYTSSVLGVVVDYPADWSVATSGERVIFTSPQGSTIFLQAGNTAPSPTGVDCTRLTNSYGQNGEICLDTAAFSYSAAFKKSAGDSTNWLTLSTVSQERPTVFFQMFDTLRPAP